MNPAFLPIAALCTLVSVSVLPAEEVKVTSVTDYFSKHLRDSNGKKIDASQLEGKVVGLYFSAEWCAPCRVFTPQLIEFRNRHLKDGFEVLFASFDDSNTIKTNYVRKAAMPWPSLPSAKSRTIRRLADRFGVKSFPTLIILAPDGSILSKTGITDVMKAPETALTLWQTPTES